MNILIIGVGLIGGSFSLALKERKELSFGGYDMDKNVLDKARELQIVGKIFNDLEDAVVWSDMIILSIPVREIKILLPAILDSIKERHVVIDFGSTKVNICEAVSLHPKRSQFIAAHPIAGTEYSGPEAAFSGLFKNKNLILCDTERTDLKKLQMFEELALGVGFYLTKMSATAHDRHLAYISHLSHISSYVLSNTVLQKEKDGEVILDLAGSGFESTVRLAKSSPAMWSSIFLENKEMVLQGIAAYREELDELEKLIQEDKEDLIFSYLEEGRKIRKILK